jgi:hypothetical protein
MGSTNRCDQRISAFAHFGSRIVVVLATEHIIPSYLPDTSVLLGFLFLCILAILLVGLWYAGIKPWRRYSLDLKQQRVESIEGRVFLNPKQRGRYRRCFIQISGLEFPVSERTMLAFQNGAPYRVFYTPNSKTVLSAEAIPSKGEA